MRSLVLAGLLLAPALLTAQSPAVLPAAPDARPISLEEAVRLAEQNAPQTVQARGQVRGSSAQVRQSLASFLPNLSLSSGASWLQGVSLVAGELVPRRGDPWSYSNGINASLDLFDGGSRFRDLARTRATEDAAEANLVAQRYTVALNVKQQYYNVLAARESEAAAIVQLEQAQQNARVANARVAAGAATKSDSLRADIQVRNAQLAILQARTALQNANASLTRLTAAPVVVTALPSDTLAPIVLAADSVVLADLVRQAPSIRQASSALAASRAAVKASRAPYWPTVSMNGRYNFQSNTEGFQAGQFWLAGRQGVPNTKNVSLSINYPLFDRLQRETAIAQAKIAEDNAEAVLRDARLAAEQQFTQALGAYELAEARIAVQRASVEAAEEDLRVQRQRYELGASTLLDVLTSQTTLNQARLALIEARRDARVAKAQLEALVGRDL